jgi:hypothetical protein
MPMAYTSKMPKKGPKNYPEKRAQKQCSLRINSIKNRKKYIETYAKECAVKRSTK